MNDRNLLAQQFEQHRPRLKAVAYRMLGSLAEADDAVQDTWLRLDRTDTSNVDSLGAWLTTVVTRVCLNALRTRKQQREDSLDVRMPDPVVSAGGADAGNDPEAQALLADSVGMALMVVLDTLTPAERVAFVLHDMFAVPFDEIAPMIDRTTMATRQLASRARKRVRAQAPTPDADLGKQRRVVDAFFAAARNGDLEALVAVLHPDIVFRLDGGAAAASPSVVVSGARNVASQASAFGPGSPKTVPVLVNGAVGVAVIVRGRLMSVTGFNVVDGVITEIDALFDQQRLRDIDLSAVGRSADGSIRT